MVKIVVYYRVSTLKQKRSGLGIEAQQHAIQEAVAKSGDEVIGTYTEHESGRRDDRPQLQLALAHARRSRARLVVAKLDRLSRDVAFLKQLQAADVAFAALDCPDATKPMLQMMMVMAEFESDQAKARTKAALAARRQRGLPLGAQNPACRNLKPRDMVNGRRLGALAQVVKADEAYSDILPLMAAWESDDWTLAEMAAELNAQGHTTRRQRRWSPGTVANVLRRVSRVD